MKKWEKEAVDWAIDKLEIILQTYKTPDFYEFIGTIGGDTLTYRYYKDGTIVER